MTRLVLGSLLATCLLAPSAFAATHHVPASFTNIQTAIDNASSGDLILVAEGVYYGPGNRDLDFHGKNLTLRSVGGAAMTVIDCGASFGDWHRAFYFHSGEEASCLVDGFTIRHGSHLNGGAFEIAGGAWPTLRDCVVTSCTAQFGGGAVHVAGEGAPRFEGCSFNLNDAASGGAVMAEGSSTPAFENCVFGWNSATSGGALFLRQGSSSTLQRATFYGNGALFLGGSIFCDAGTSAELESSIVSFTSRGQAVECRGGGSASLACSDVVGNALGDWTGCIAGQAGAEGNFTADPLYCMTPGFVLHIRQGSPCVWRSACSSQIGALGQGCPRRGPVVEQPGGGKRLIAKAGGMPSGQTEEASWGTMKHLFLDD